jgi:predicted flap endonuclease-1-like 5' DNA nuclease
MTQDQNSEECRTKCLWASAGGGVLALVLFMALFGAAFLVALLLAVIVFFGLAYGLPRYYCAQAQDEQPAAPAKAAAPVMQATPAKAVEKPTEKPIQKLADSAPAAPVAETPAKTPAKPAASAKAEETSDVGGTQPATLSAPRAGKADNLKRIKGVGPKLESLLHEMGFYHFDQIAGWTADEVTWVDENLQGVNKGRASRDDWVAQATVLASGDETEFSKRATTGGGSK